MSAPAPQRRKKIDGAGKEAHPSSAQARGSSFSALHFMKALFSAAQPFRMSLWHAYRFRCVGILAAWTGTMAQSSEQCSERMWKSLERQVRVAGREEGGQRAARLHLGGPPRPFPDALPGRC